jgi:cytochrome c
MPWNAPKSLSTDEVYAVTAFLLNLGGVVPDNFVLSNQNIREVQGRMPNRNGMSTDHAMWPGHEFGGRGKKPDTQNVACMKDCVTEPKVSSFLPDYARNAHGNLAEQNRLIGPQHGIDTTQPVGKPGSVATTAPASAAAPAKAEPKAGAKPEGDSKAVQALLSKYSCTACHALDRKLVGPGFQEIARKHAGKADYLAGKIRSGGSGVWGPVPMPAQSLSESEAKTLGAWLASGAGK